MNNPFSLRNKKILITGASSGIGRAVAIECSHMGADIIFTGRNKERLLSTLDLMGTKENHRLVEADLVKEEGINKITDSIKYPLDGVVHCAGIVSPKSFIYNSADDINNIMQINFCAPLFLSKSLLKAKKLNRGASIVFVSSISGVVVSSAGSSIYSASKGAINGLVKGLALETAPKNIRVNCVNPGMIDTDIFSETVISQEQLEKDIKRYPLKRYGKPEEVAYAIIYLLSDASSWTTGSNIVIDGGFTLL
jgi:NAD(P)-dependent dehydrogenase (short-subunit alcohol dehydrogenase family)